MTSIPSLLPTACYICEQPAKIEPGRNSYLVDCTHCGVRYEMDLTAWATPVQNPQGVLAWIRHQQADGDGWPYVTKHSLQEEGRSHATHIAGA
jgi:hypothetical protein